MKRLIEGATNSALRLLVSFSSFLNLPGAVPGTQPGFSITQFIFYFPIPFNPAAAASRLPSRETARVKSTESPGKTESLTGSRLKGGYSPCPNLPPPLPRRSQTQTEGSDHNFTLGYAVLRLGKLTGRKVECAGGCH